MTIRKPLSTTPQEDAKRLKALFEARTSLSQTEFGERYEIGNQGAVWQYLNGRRPLSLKAAKGFAEGLGVKIEEFSPSIAATVQAAEALTTSEVRSIWPFSAIDEEKVRALDQTVKAHLEGAILVAAAQLGLDVKK